MTGSSRRLRAAAAVATGLVVAVLGGIATVDRASASSLTVDATRSGIAVSTACTSADVQVEPTTAGSVHITGLSAADLAACAGLDAEVTLYGAAGVLATATGSLTDGTLALSGPVDPSAVSRVRVLVGAFALRASWHVPGPAPDGCYVADKNGTAAATPCSITSITSGTWWGSPGDGYGQITAHFSAPGIQEAQHVEFTFTVPPAVTPAWWTWQGAVITQANNAADITSRCADLPTVTGRIEQNKGETPEVFLQLQQRSASSPLCRP